MSESPSNVVDFGSESMLAAALQYARLGWHVLPIWQPVFHDDGPATCGCGKADCQAIGKHPHGFLARNGQEGATTDEATIRGWFERVPRLNIAINLHKSGLVAVDIDTYAGGDLSIEILEAQHGPIRSNVSAITGGGGEHRVFDAPAIGGLPGRLGKGIDLKANGYIVVEPSIHRSGRRYEWEGSSDPREYSVPSAIPDWIRDLANVRQIAEPVARASRFVTEAQVEELRSALTYLDADDYHQWVDCGLALKGIGGVGFELWDEWSQRSSKYLPLEMGHKWRGFKPGSLNFESIFFWAQNAGWVNPLAGGGPPVETVCIIEEEETKAPDMAPVTSSRLPMLNQIPVPQLMRYVEWIENNLSEEPNRDVSILSALNIAAVTTGRIFESTSNNNTNLYTALMAPTGLGKEYAIRGITLAMFAAGCQHLISGSGNTSSGAVFSALYTSPCHIQIMNEMGKRLFRFARKQPNGSAADAMSTLVDAYSTSNSILIRTNYSSIGLSKQERARMDSPHVVRPSITIMGVATPGQIFDNLSDEEIDDGLLNRFIVVMADLEDTLPERPFGSMTVPEDIATWIKHVRTVNYSKNTDHGSVELHGESDYDCAIVPFSVAIDADAKRLFDEYKRWIKSTFFVEPRLKQRWRENAMRMATGLAAFRDPEHPVVTADLAEWCIAYVTYHGQRFMDAVALHVADNDFHRLLKAVSRLVERGGPKGPRHGITDGEMAKASRLFEHSPTLLRKAVTDALMAQEVIARRDIRTPSGRGKPRIAWVWCASEDQGTDE